MNHEPYEDQRSGAAALGCVIVLSLFAVAMIGGFLLGRWTA